MISGCDQGPVNWSPVINCFHPKKVQDVAVKQTCRSSVAVRLSVIWCFTAADGSASRPGWFQKVTQWNDASKTWLEHHMTHLCAETHFPHSLLKLERDIHACSFLCIFLYFKRVCFPSLSQEIVAYSSRCHAQVTDGLDQFSKLNVKRHPESGRGVETDGTIASPWSGLHFLILSGARVCLPVGYGSDGRLSSSRLLPGKTYIHWNQKGVLGNWLDYKKGVFHW